MLLHGATDGVLCRAFPSLRKAARYWYSSLESNSIHSFNQLGLSFAANFVNYKRMQEGSNSLVNIKKRARISHVNWFNAALKIYNQDHAVTMIAMKSGLRKCPFLFSLKKRAPTDFSEMLARAEKYAHTKEAHEMRKPPSSPPIREWPSIQEFQQKKEDQGRGRQRIQSPPWC